MTNAYLTEALDLVNDMTCDVNGEFPIGLIRLRWLLEQVLAADDDDEETMTLTEEPPTDSVHPEGI